MKQPPVRPREGHPHAQSRTIVGREYAGVVKFGYGCNVTQSQAIPWGGPALVKAVKALENASRLMGRRARPIVGDAGLDAAFGPGDRDVIWQIAARGCWRSREDWQATGEQFRIAVYPNVRRDLLPVGPAVLLSPVTEK